MQNIATPAVSVIVVNWNGADYLPRCLAALRQQTYRDFELILIDNASTDDSLKLAATVWPDIAIYRQSENTGFAKANNLGAALAKSKWLALLNSDAYPETAWLENLMKAADEYPQDRFFTSCQMQAHAPALLDGTGDEYHVSGFAWRRHYGEPVENAPRVADEVFSACGAAAMYPRQAFLDAGGFDADFFAYLEDVDLAFRLRHRGYRCLYVPDARVLHVGSASTGTQSEFALYHTQKNMVWLYLKNMPMPLFWQYAAHHLAANLYFFMLYSFCCCPCLMLRAKWAALAGLPRFLAKRKTVQQSSIVRPADLLNVMKLPRRRSATWSGAFMFVPNVVRGFFASVRKCRKARRTSLAVTRILQKPVAHSGRNGRRRILFIDDRLPNPGLGAGYPRARKILDALADQGFQIAFYPFVVNAESGADAREFLPAGTEYLGALSPHHLRDFLAARRSQFDFVWVSRPHNMRLLLAQIPDPAEWETLLPRLIYDAEAVYALREKIRAEILGLAFDEAQLAREKALARRAQSIVVVAAQEAGFFASTNVPVNVLVHSIELNPTPGTFKERRGFVFIGPIANNQTPNADALIYLLRELWPKIKASLPRATLKIIGANAVLHEFQPYFTDAIEYLGEVSAQELFERANQARVHIVPTRFAAGVPLKTMTSAALGLPMVATLLIQEQLAWANGELLPADWRDAADFANQCVHLHEDRDLWESVRATSLLAVGQLSDPANFGAALKRIMQEVSPHDVDGIPAPAGSPAHRDKDV